MKESVLLINNNDTGKMIDSFLTKSGYVVYNAGHGLKALRILNNSNISVIIYEVISEQQAEFGFLEYIKKKHPSIPVIVISQSNEVNLAINVMKFGAFDYLITPIEIEKLFNSITRAISEKNEMENKIVNERRNNEYQKILLKELEITKREMENLKKELYVKNLELELIHQKRNQNQTQIKINEKRDEISKFTILEEIGRGGMSVVYKAIDHSLNREVAIKQLSIFQKNLSPKTIEDLTKRFIKEAQVVAMLKHENIVKVFDIIEEKKKHYMIMEFIEGKTLDKLIAGNKKIPVMESVNIVSEICLALDYIHGHNIIHRDIKPSNIIIGNDRVVKLMDFGVIRDNSVSTITETGSIIGTISYTSPEQNSNNFDFRVDIFSLATILYELLTGENPFKCNTYAETFLRISSVIPKPPSYYNPECSETLDRIVIKGMEKNPKQRYMRARDFYYDLIAYKTSYQASIA